MSTHIVSDTLQFTKEETRCLFSYNVHGPYDYWVDWNNVLNTAPRIPIIKESSYNKYCIYIIFIQQVGANMKSFVVWCHLAWLNMAAVVEVEVINTWWLIITSFLRLLYIVYMSLMISEMWSKFAPTGNWPQSGNLLKDVQSFHLNRFGSKHIFWKFAYLNLWKAFRIIKFNFLIGLT